MARTSRERHRKASRRNAMLLAGPAMAWLAIFVMIPLAMTVVVSFWTSTLFGLEATWSARNWVRAFSTPIYADLIMKTIRIALLTTAITLVLSWPIALFLSRLRGTSKAVFVLLLFLPFWIGYVVRTFAWLPILGREGLINRALMGLGVIERPIDWLLYNEGTVYLGLIYVYLLFMVLPIFLSLDKIDRGFLEAAADLGASRSQQLRYILLPLSLPGVLAGSIIVFLMAFGAYVTPALLGGPSGIMFSNVIATQFLVDNNWAFGATLSLIMVVFVLATLLLASPWIGLREIFVGRGDVEP